MSKNLPVASLRRSSRGSAATDARVLALGHTVPVHTTSMVSAISEPPPSTPLPVVSCHDFGPPPEAARAPDAPSGSAAKRQTLELCKANSTQRLTSRPPQAPRSRSSSPQADPSKPGSSEHLPHPIAVNSSGHSAMSSPGIEQQPSSRSIESPQQPSPSSQTVPSHNLRSKQAPPVYVGPPSRADAARHAGVDMTEYGELRGSSHHLRIGDNQDVRMFFSRTGKPYLAMRDLFSGIMEKEVQAQQSFTNTLRFSPYGVSGPQAGLLVETQHVIGTGNLILFAPLQIAADIMKRYASNAHGDAKAELSSRVATLLEDLGTLVSKAKRGKRTSSCVTQEGLEELGASAVQTFSEAPSASVHNAMSEFVSNHLMDAFPMESMQDTPRVQLNKLSTAVTNMLDKLKPSIAIQSEVFSKINGLSEEEVSTYMDTEYSYFRMAGIRGDVECLGEVMKNILENDLSHTPK